MKSHAVHAALSILFVVCSTPLTFAEDLAPVPVQYGGEADFDACSPWAIADGIDTLPEKMLPVRSGPGPEYPVVGRIPAEKLFAVCDQNDDESWFGIVYPTTDEQFEKECELGAGVAERIDYAGICPFGWVEAKNVKPMTG